MTVRTIRELQAAYALTPRERELWQHVFDFWVEYGMSPSIYEMAPKMGLCGSTIARKLKNMRRKGYIDWPENHRRAIRCYPILSEGMTQDWTKIKTSVANIPQKEG